jgi:LysM domain
MMLYPTPAALLIGVMLSASVVHGGFDRAVARPVAASGEASGSIPKTGPAASVTPGSRKAPAIVAETAAPVTPPPAAGQPAAKPRGRAYLFRGALGLIFSRGMDRLTERIERAGIEASVNEFTVCGFIAEKAIRAYRQDPAPITLIGHSMGGLCALKFAEMLQAEDIPASLVVTVDPAQASPNVPLNVQRYINIFLSTNILGGRDVVPKEGYQGHYASYDLAQHENIIHINIDKVDSIHEQLVPKIRQLATTAPKGEGEAVPIRYVVPADAAIELWDSGMPVFARSGDTLQALSAFHRVPLWSLTQINQVPDSAALPPGQRIIVPRQLVPPAPLPRQPPSRR